MTCAASGVSACATRTTPSTYRCRWVPSRVPAETPNVVAPLRPAEERIVAAALELFAEHGVGGTSLQMIADSLGVTKAAVYHQYNSKEEIVIAAAGAELARLEAARRRGRGRTGRSSAHASRCVDQIVDLAVDRRRMESSLLGDPVIVRYFARPRAVPRRDGSPLPAPRRRRPPTRGAGVGRDARRRHRWRGDAPARRRPRRRHVAAECAVSRPVSSRRPWLPLQRGKC